MDSYAKYASIEDVASALEIILNDKKDDINNHKIDDKKDNKEDNKEDDINDHIKDAMLSKTFSIDNTFKIINFCCIKDTDQVLVISNYCEIMMWIISYVYIPNKIIAKTVHSNSCFDKSKWEDFHLLLTGYQYTKPTFNSNESDQTEDLEQAFDVVIIGLHNPVSLKSEKTMNRFYLETGTDYELFEKYLIKASEDLKDNGVLIILSKPGWILKAWSLLDLLNLQLDYNNYRLYVDSIGNPNAFVWLRFIKNSYENNPELNKRNVLNLMRDNNIDRLFTHKNSLLFPYVELQEYDSEAYVDLNQNNEYMQYFFTIETTINLSKLCDGYTACLVTPSIAQCAHKAGKNIVLFERDNRFRENGGVKIY